MLGYIYSYSFFFFFNDPATTEIYTLPYTTLFRSGQQLHDQVGGGVEPLLGCVIGVERYRPTPITQPRRGSTRSEEHTSELQSQSNLVCRLLLEKNKNSIHQHNKYMTKTNTKHKKH